MLTAVLKRTVVLTVSDRADPVELLKERWFDVPIPSFPEYFEDDSSDDEVAPPPRAVVSCNIARKFRYQLAFGGERHGGRMTEGVGCGSRFGLK